MKLRSGRPLFAALAVLAGGCALPLDLLGEDEVVQLQSQSLGQNELADDRIEDKHPAVDPTLTIDEVFDGCTVTLNKSGAVTKLDVVPFDASDQAIGATLFPTYTSAAAALGSRTILPSMEVVNAALKPFDDGLYAAVELGAEDASQGSPIAKRALLTDLLTELLAHATSGTAAEQPLAREAAGTIGAALQLGGGQPPGAIASQAASLIDAFNADPFTSRPVGFYTWSPTLSAIFRQDRLLQSAAPSFGAFAATAVVLNADTSLAARYTQILNLYAGLTNPFFDRPVTDLLSFAPTATSLGNLNALQAAFRAAHPETTAADPSCAAKLSFLPASDSPDTRLFRTLYCEGHLPPNSNLLDVLIGAIQSGAIDLTPTATSGWYDRQIYALETLLVPDRATEKDHLFLTHRYKEKLVETFKTLITETRETHVKQLGTFSRAVGGIAVLPTVNVYPLLPVEPFPTFYLRTARAYAFVKTLLDSAMGQTFMATASRVLESGGTSGMSLDAELTDRTTLLYGLHVLSSASIGMRPALASDEAAAFPPDADGQRAQLWLASWLTDADVGKDPRVIVPVSRDLQANTARYWAVLGTNVVKIRANFYPGFEPQWIQASFCQLGSFVNVEPYLLTGQTVEVTRPLMAPPPTRDEFRALCDREKTANAIVRALENP